MRVLHVGKYFAPFAGGIENFMLDLIGAAGPLGVAHSVLVHASPGSAAGGPPPGAGDVRVERVATRGQFVYAPVAPGFPRALERMLAQAPPDLVHVHMPNTSAFWLLANRRARRVPWLVHWHSDVVGPGLDRRLGLLYPFYRPLEQRLLARAAAVVATSRPYLDTSSALARWREKCRVIPLGLDERRLEPRAAAEPGWGRSGRLRVLAVGRATAYKGFEVLVRAAIALPEVEIIVAGGGERRHRCERLVPPGEAGRIRFAGPVDDAVRNELIAGCDVLVLPSLNRAEAFGMALLEAMALGRPTVATSVHGSGMGWVVDHGRSGWLVPPGEVDALARCLRGLHRDRERLERAGAAARRRFERHFRIDAVASRFVALYRELAGGAAA